MQIQAAGSRRILKRSWTILFQLNIPSQQVVGRNKGSQSVMLSWFGSAGSVSRILYPIVAGAMTSAIGDWSAFVLVACLEVVGLGCVVWLMLFQNIT